MARTIRAAIFLSALWLLMSGLFKPLLISFGIASVLTAIYVSRRMDAQDRDQPAISLSPLHTARYFLWLMGEIAKANWAVTRLILSRNMPIRQHLFTVPITQETDLAQVIFANSVTLTPGTITVETEGYQFLVHAVSYSDEVSAELAQMDAQVTKCERAN